MPAIVRNDARAVALVLAERPRQKLGWWVGAALVGAALTLAFILGQYSRSNAVANTATQKVDVSAPLPAAPDEPVLAAVSRELPEVAAAEPRPSARGAKPAVAAASPRVIPAAAAVRPKKPAPEFGRTAEELDVGY